MCEFYPTRKPPLNPRSYTRLLKSSTLLILYNLLAADIYKRVAYFNIVDVLSWDCDKSRSRKVRA